MYRAMRDVGMPNPRLVDELELWEIAVLIGADGYEPETRRTTSTTTTAPRGARDLAHLRERVAARRAAGTDEVEGSGSIVGEPTFHDAPPDAAMLDLMTALGGSSV